MEEGEPAAAFVPHAFAADLFAPSQAPPDQNRQASSATTASGPSTLSSWDGVKNSDNTFFVSPKVPDAEGDVGLNDYVQWVNLMFKIWDKSGALRYGPAAGNTLWSGFGGPCEQYNWGDPQVQFDRIANRWVFMQFAFPTNFTEPVAPFYLCFAVSKTGDPTGSYYRYAFRVNAFPDYPKLGVWPDGYYVTTNNFSGGSRTGTGVFAFDRTKMLAGDPGAGSIEYELDPYYSYLLPASFTGSTLPPSGAPEYFAAIESPHCGVTCTSMFGSRVWIWRFHADFAVPSNSSFSGPTNLGTFYTSMCTGRNCIPQPGTAQKVDSASDHLMQRLQYRSFGSYESLVATHTVDPGTGVAGLRWYEIQASPPGGAPSLAEQSTYAPEDGIHRWMGSAATDGVGNIALGYSMSNGTSVYPSVGYTGSAPGSGTMGLGETTMIAGGGSQTGSNRWGDYSAMAIDPSDDETFWYTQQYYSATSSLGWQTRIGSFRLAQGPSATLTRVSGNLVAFPYVTNQSVSSIAGGCTPGEGTVSWSVGGAASEGGSASCASGTWSASLSTPLSSDGSYTLSAAQGVASSPSQTLMIDTTAPDPPTLTALPPFIGNGQPLSATNVGDNGGGSGVKQVNYLYCPESSCPPDTLIGSSSTASDDYAVSWSGQPADGPYKVMAQSEDNAGNTADSSIQATAIDNGSPHVTLNKVNGGPVSFPFHTNESVTSIGGSCGTASGDDPTVDWSVTGTASDGGSAACSPEGWSAAVSLSVDGPYTLSASQGDQAGHTGSSGNRSLMIDTTPPATPTMTATDPPSPADDNEPKVKGVAEAGSTVRIYRSGDCSGPVAVEGGAADFGSPGLAISVAENQTVQLTATATDAAGNTSTCSESTSYTESTPPEPSKEGPPPSSPPSTPPAPVPNPSPPPSPGTAFAKKVALVKRGKALLRLACRGAGRCGGSLRLVARIRVQSQNGARRSRRRFRNLVVGRIHFSIPAHRTRTVRVRLNRKGRRLMREAGRTGRKVKLRGSGVSNRIVWLRTARKRRRRGRGSKTLSATPWAVQRDAAFFLNSAVRGRPRVETSRRLSGENPGTRYGASASAAGRTISRTNSVLRRVEREVGGWLMAGSAPLGVARRPGLGLGR